jgi:Ala-tRNA(Pro) deacylase
MNVEHYLQEHGIGYEKHKHKPTFTAQTLAAEEHASGYEVAKPVVVRSGEKFTMCVVPACVHLDLARVADVLHQPDVRMATEAEMAGLFPDCELGAEPPIGAMFGMNTIMDERLLEDEYLTMQAGTHTEAIRLRRRDFEGLCSPTIAQIAQA